MNRRDFIQAESGGAALASFGKLAAQALQHNPFLLGVASGSPGLDGFVLWTRLLATPQGDPLPPSAIDVDWELASDSDFRRVVRSGRTLALPQEAHSVHVEVVGLPPVEGNEPPPTYWYRFSAGQALSSVGKTRALPAAASPCDWPWLLVKITSTAISEPTSTWRVKRWIWCCL